MPLNSNNFLRWIGSTTKAPFSFTLVGVSAILYANQDSVSFNPLFGSSAIRGIDTYSLYLESAIDQDGNPVAFAIPNEWDGVSVFTFYRLPNPLTIAIYFTFRFRDDSGNLSGPFTCSVNVSTVTTTWIPYPPSASCNLDNFGENNGLLSWSQLKLVNSATLADIIPLTLKDNLISDSDFYPPITDLITCPVPTGGQYAQLTIANFSLNPANGTGNFITINAITVACSACGSGGTPMLQVFPANIPPGRSQKFLIPAIAWDNGLTIQYDVTGDMATVPFPIYWRSQTNGVVDDFPTGAPHQVDNSGIYGNFSITVTFPNGLTIFCQ
jgi:hypothetical protein